MPKASAYFLLDPHLSIDAAKVISWLLKDYLEAEFYDAIFAGYSMEIQNLMNCIEIKIYGFDQKLMIFVKRVMEFIRLVEVEEKDLERLVFFYNS